MTFEKYCPCSANEKACNWHRNNEVSLLRLLQRASDLLEDPCSVACWMSERDVVREHIKLAVGETF